MPLVKELYDRVVGDHVGWLTRHEGSWLMHLWDSAESRGGRSAYRFAVHPDGYAVFRVGSKWGDRGPEGELEVRELVTATPTARAALWRYLLDYDQVRQVTGMVAADEPVIPMLADQRQATRGQKDSLWVRLVDVDRALALRTYSAPVDTVFEVTDSFCPWNEGRWHMTVTSADGPATVSRTTRDPDVLIDVADLGAIFLGGTRLTELAAAGLVTELTPGSVVRTSRAFAGDRQPHCPEIF
ncbi:hypothetical protein GCM10029964_019600 [Kibdelosporangium lantanae]